MKIGETKQFECEGEGLQFEVELSPQDGDPNVDMGEVTHCPFCGGEVTPKQSKTDKFGMSDNELRRKFDEVQGRLSSVHDSNGVCIGFMAQKWTPEFAGGDAWRIGGSSCTFGYSEQQAKEICLAHNAELKADREKREQAEQLSQFVHTIIEKGGAIVTSEALTPGQIAVSRAAGKMFVTPDGFGLHLMPKQWLEQQNERMLSRITMAATGENDEIAKLRSQLLSAEKKLKEYESNKS